ncbi:hypothetical protein ACGFYY_15650 [Streptomyces sp. NPDC048331]|uniref:hypothetical protein n=1 Tax=Streptomyces sp. NPDC048331 TaxID=3365534 RepID=UPI003712B2CE
MDSFSAELSSFTDHLSVLAPRSLAALRPPAPRPVLEEACRELGVRPAPDLVHLYQAHDGAEASEAGWFLPSERRLLPLMDARAVGRRLTAMIDGEDVLGTWWHPQWFPFAANHDAWSVEFVDLREGAAFGSVGSFFGEGASPGIWPSLGAYFKELTHALEGGDAPIQRRTPVVKDDVLSWE